MDSSSQALGLKAIQEAEVGESEPGEPERLVCNLLCPSDQYVTLTTMPNYGLGVWECGHLQRMASQMWAN